jgi:hypothetical protein
VLDVVDLDVTEVGEDPFVDQERRGFPGRQGERRGCRRAIAPPLADQAGVLFVALRGVVGAEVLVFPVDGHDGTIPGFVVAVAGLSGGTGHGAISEVR